MGAIKKAEYERIMTDYGMQNYDPSLDPRYLDRLTEDEGAVAGIRALSGISALGGLGVTANRMLKGKRLGLLAPLAGVLGTAGLMVSKPYAQSFENPHVIKG